MSKYNTKQRDEIIACLKHNKDRHLSANDIYILLSQSGKSVGMTTVYRNLESLCDDGRLLKFNANGCCCFQLAGSGCHEHYHMICDRCGRLMHIECDEIERFTEHFKKHHGFTVDMTKTTLYGVCAECEKEAE